MTNLKYETVSENASPLSTDIVTKIRNEVKIFSIDAIIEDLPGMLKAPCKVLVEETEKEVFLLGALGIISGMLPNIKGKYAGKWISPNLFVYVLAGYAAGKGALEYARALGAKIQEDKRLSTEIIKNDYLKAIEVYNRDLKNFHRSKNEHTDPPEKPAPPPTLTLFTPANISKSGLYQLLHENHGRGILFESEGDTLADALRQDYGGFSDTLRKTFHHEDLSFFRRTGSEMIEIPKPELSAVLSSTFDQLRLLIPSVENGLFSRFLYYILKTEERFVDVFDERKEAYVDYFDRAGETFKELYDYLTRLDTPIWFYFSTEQKKRFVKIFGEKKSKLMEEIDEAMAGTVNRLGIIAYRIMMIFTALRAYEKNQLRDKVQCSDVDFNNALQIIERLEKHAGTVYQFLNRQPSKKELAEMLNKEGKSFGEISNIIFGDETHKSTIYRWLKGKK